jgi:hypothetical protein
LRELLSVRMLAAVVGLLAALWLVSVVTGDDSGEGAALGPTSDGSVATVDVVERRIDLVAQIVDLEPVDAVAGFAVRVEGDEPGSPSVAIGSADLVLEGDRRMRIVSGTFGVDDCSTAEKRVGRCAVLADLLGEAVVWFRLAPIDDRHVELPAVVAFVDDLARLADGLLLPHAEVFTRRCTTEYASFTEFRRDLGEDFVTLWSLDEGRLTDVICRR